LRGLRTHLPKELKRELATASLLLNREPGAFHATAGPKDKLRTTSSELNLSDLRA
jgi:hypothetical protein